MSREIQTLERIRNILAEKWIPEQVVFHIEREIDRYSIHDQVKSCTSCELHKNCYSIVPGAGPMPADIMMVGEA